MLDDKSDDLLRDAARDYNAPPETPREVMWAAIQAKRAQRESGQADRRTDGLRGSSWPRETGEPSISRPAARPSLRRLYWAAGIAAALALGIGLGRISTNIAPNSVSPVPAPGPVATQPTPRVSTAAYQLATTEHLSQSEAFLTLFRASLRGGSGNERLASATARQLLATNRLLLDSPAAKDRKTRLLLQDLELVLAEITQLLGQARARDLDLITEGLEQGGVLSRLRTAVPSGASPTQGAL
jgi:hypothetical protein